MGWYEANDRRWHVRRGQALFVQRDVPPAYGSDDDDPWSIQWAHFRGALAESYLQLLNVRPEKSLLTIGIAPNFIALFNDALAMMRSGYGVYPTAYRRSCEADHPGRTALVAHQGLPARP